MPSDDPVDTAFTIVAPRSADEPSKYRSEPNLDSLVGRYRIARRIGKGGMGEVMGAHDDQVGREVAIKRMRAANPNPRQIERFLREASIQGRLEHPAIVPVHEIGRDVDGLPFFVMKKLAGRTLSDILAGNRVGFPLQRVLRAFTEVCLAVEFAHVRGIIHRDLKPDNIILGDFGEVYVIDWGVAKVIGEEDGEFADIGSGSGEHATKAGTAIGTAGYMAPEQAQGVSDIDGRTDIYTLGCLLFEILAGQTLHPSGRVATLLADHDRRPSLRAPMREIPPELDALCVHATMIDPHARVQTARELGDRVQQFLDGDRDLALRRGLAHEHLERGRAAFDAGDSEDLRRTAMREAASALALDPALTGAAELVGRLMLEPPRTTPREVDEAIAVDDTRTARANALAGGWALVAALVFTPLMWWIAPDASAYVAAFTGVILLNGVVCIHAYKSKIPRPGLIVIGNTLLLVVVARMFSPLLVAPGVAAVLAMAMVLTPRFSVLGSAATVAVLLIIAVLGPMLLERVGAISSTLSVDASGILFHAPAVVGREGPTILVGSLYAIALIIGACAMAGTMRQRTRDAHRHLHLQAWQLGQLVPR